MNIFGSGAVVRGDNLSDRGRWKLGATTAFTVKKRA